MISFLNEFKKFAVRGNVLDLAVGVVVGTAFNKIVSSFVADIIMPPLGFLLGGVSFSNLVFTLKKQIVDGDGVVLSEAINLNYGLFLQNIFDFVIIAFSVFLIIRIINRFHEKRDDKKEPAKDSAELLTLKEIRDLLKDK